MDKLNIDLISVIVNYTDIESMYNLAQVDKFYNKVIMGNKIHHMVLKRDYPNFINNYNISNKEFYIAQINNKNKSINSTHLFKPSSLKRRLDRAFVHFIYEIEIDIYVNGDDILESLICSGRRNGEVLKTTVSCQVDRYRRWRAKP